MMATTAAVFLCLTLTSSVFVQADEDADEVCDPSIADTCFTDVEKDIRAIFYPGSNTIDSDNTTALRDLCSAWNDSLSCTSDIIDSGCKIAEGKLQFDTWNNGLKRVVEFLCSDHLENLRAFVDSIHCWNAVKFVRCTEANAGLTSIASLLKTPLDVNECKVLQDSLSTCNFEATDHVCASYPVTKKTLEGAITAFFAEIDCNQNGKPQASVGQSGTTTVRANHVLILSSIVMLLRKIGS